MKDISKELHDHLSLKFKNPNLELELFRIIKEYETESDRVVGTRAKRELISVIDKFKTRCGRIVDTNTIIQLIKKMDEAKTANEDTDPALS